MKLLKFFLRLSIVLTVLIFIGGFIYIRNIINNTPSIDNLINYQHLESSKVYDRNGVFITRVGERKQYFVSIDKIPEQLIHAFLSTEDKTFYVNSGIDIMGNIRAVVANIKNLGKQKRPVGASTITQQVIKNILLTNEVTLKRKFQEIYLAIQITKKLNKDRILEIYLNHIFLGRNSYGIKAAAMEYFNKDLHELTIPEIAILATLPKSPVNFNPYKYPDKSLRRRNWVLERMKEDGFISEDQYQEYITTPIVLAQKEDFYGYDFIEIAIEQMNKIYNINTQDLSNKGYDITLKMDAELQKNAQHVLNSGLMEYDKRHGYRGPIAKINITDKTTQDIQSAIGQIQKDEKMKHLNIAIVTKVSDDNAEIMLQNNQIEMLNLPNILWARKYIDNNTVGDKIQKMQDVLNTGDVILVQQINNEFTLEQVPEIEGGIVIAQPTTGDVLAVVGGYENIQARFNRATMAKRQIGSTIKPFIYYEALNNKYTPATLMEDTNMEFNFGDNITWNPKNWTNKHLGKVTIRKALEQSINTITLQIANDLGMKKVTNTLQNFGILEHESKEYDLSVALGSVEITLLDLIKSYSMFLNNGNKIEFQFIDNIKQKNNTILFSEITQEGTKFENFSPQSAYQIVNIMESIYKKTIKDKNLANIPFSGKTGTSNEGVDLWFVGFNKDIIIGVFAGYDTPKTTGANEYGATVAFPIFKKLLPYLSNYIQNTPFDIPEGINFAKINTTTGFVSSERFDGRKIIYEAFKDSDVILEESDSQESKQTDLMEGYE